MLILETGVMLGTMKPSEAFSFAVNRHEKSGNEQFLTELSKWVFHERGHLKVRDIYLVSCELGFSFFFFFCVFLVLLFMLILSEINM